MYKVQLSRRDYYYVCRKYGQKAMGIEPCDCPKLYGPTVERQVWEAVKEFLRNPERFMEARNQRQGGEEKISGTIRDLDRQLRQVTDNETKLMGEEFQGRYSPEALSRKAKELRGQRSALEAAKVREAAALSTSRQAKAGFEALAAMRLRVLAHLDTATPERQQWVLQCLDARVEVSRQGKLLDLGVPGYVLDAISDQKGQI